MDFVWDPAKAKSNVAKHGVDFEQAQAVFDDPNALTEVDWSNSDEERWRMIGSGHGNILFVVYIEIADDCIRLISARKATRHEQDRYYRQAFPEE